MDSKISGVYHPRNPEQSSLWKILNTHYESFEAHYEQKFEKKYGYFRPIIREVVEEYLRCGDLKEGFARVRCSDCPHTFLINLYPIFIFQIFNSLKLSQVVAYYCKLLT